MADARAQFQIPAYLLAPAPGRRYDEEGVGTGIIWLGLILIAIPAVTGNLSPISVGAWVAGLILTAGGILRARQDGQSMLRAGALTAAAGVLTLAFLGNQIVDYERASDTRTASLLASSTAIPTPEPTSTGDSLASTLIGSNPMFRGSPDHAGVLAGPSIDGRPYRSWRYDAGRGIRSSPAIAGAVAYFGTREGTLVALDLLTHTPRWTFDLGGFPVRSSPAVVDGTVFLANGFSVVAIDAVSGLQRWKFAMDYAGESSPVVVDGMVYVASKENNLYALDAETGERRWFFKTDGLIFGSPSVASDVVIVGGDDGDLFALDRETGHLAWKVRLDAGIFSTPAVAGDRVFVTTRDQTTAAVSIDDGSVLWEYPVGGSASPAVADSVVFVSSDDGALYALDTKGGAEPLWLFATGSSDIGSPVVVGSEVVFVSGRTIIGLDRAAGTPRWQYPAGASITTEPVILDGHLFVGDENGYFSAIVGDASLATPVTGSPGSSRGKPGST